MRTSRVWGTVGLLVAWCALARPIYAQTADTEPQALRAEIERLRSEFTERLAALEARLAALGGAQPAAPAEAPADLTPALPPDVASADTATLSVPPAYGGAPAGSKIFNPDIAVVGNFLGAAGTNSVRPEPALQMAESEMSLQAIVDPYARADFFFAFGESGVDLEEGFLTFPTLPAGLLMKVGKVRSAFGKVNALHTHALSWTDRPLVTENLVGGEEGMSDAGISMARVIPNRWLFLEATGEVFRGDSGELFRSSQRSDLSYVGHLRGYQDVTESANLDVGASIARGHNAAGVVDDIDLGRFTTTLFGVDATVRWRPLRRSIYRSFLGRSEFVWSRRDQPGGRQAATGFYVSGDYQLGRRWRAGLRLDRSARAEDASMRDSGHSLTVTYVPSEFSQVRGQYRRTQYAEGVTANELLFQFQFGIGVHGAHRF